MFRWSLNLILRLQDGWECDYMNIIAVQECSCQKFLSEQGCDTTLAWVQTRQQMYI